MDAFHAERDHKAQLQKEQPLEAEAATARRKEALYHSQMPSNWDKVYLVSPSSSDSESNASGSSSPPNKPPSKGSLQTQLTFQPVPGTHPIKKTRMGNPTEYLDDPDAEGETNDGSELKDLFPAPEVPEHSSVTRTSTNKSIFTAHPTQTRAPASLLEIHFKKLPIDQQIANQERRPAQQKEKCCSHQNQAILPVRNNSVFLISFFCSLGMLKISFLLISFSGGRLFRSGTPFLPDDVVTHINNDLQSISLLKKVAENCISNIAYILSHLPGMVIGKNLTPDFPKESIWIDVKLTAENCRNSMLSELSVDEGITPNHILTQWFSPQVMYWVSPNQWLCLHTKWLTCLSEKTVKGPLTHLLRWQPQSTYQRLDKALDQAWAITKMAEQANQWQVQKLDDSGVHAAHYMFQASYHKLTVAESGSEASNTNGIFLLVKHFCGAMAGLAYLCSYSDPGGNKNLHERAQSPIISKQLCMFSGLLVFGPNASFTSTPSDASHGNALCLLELGANLLRPKSTRH
ncbi:hypothetical protein MJO29_006475 [Puccinia striiformis f. sp. tritici]|nr:hypothetical protein MJO29_006475 [Puccinia striiformis f. sp. tritici]